MYFSPSVGTSFYVGPGNCVHPPTTDGVGCAWSFSEIPLASTALITAYGSDFYDNFSQDLLNSEWLGSANNLSRITRSLDCA